MKLFVSVALAAAMAFTSAAQAEFTLDSRYTDPAGDRAAEQPPEPWRLDDADALCVA